MIKLGGSPVTARNMVKEDPRHYYFVGSIESVTGDGEDDLYVVDYTRSDSVMYLMRFFKDRHPMESWALTLNKATSRCSNFVGRDLPLADMKDDPYIGDLLCWVLASPQYEATLRAWNLRKD